MDLVVVSQIYQFMNHYSVEVGFLVSRIEVAADNVSDYYICGLRLNKNLSELKQELRNKLIIEFTWK